MAYEKIVIWLRWIEPSENADNIQTHARNTSSDNRQRSESSLCVEDDNNSIEVLMRDLVSCMDFFECEEKRLQVGLAI